MTTESYYIINKSSVDISILPYKFGKVDSPNILNLEKDADTIIENNVYGGKSSYPTYMVEYFSYVDSILVIWNNEYEVLHIADNDSYTGERKTIDTNSTRCVGAVQHYELSKEEKKRSVLFSLKYTFTESDYEFAKD